VTTRWIDFTELKRQVRIRDVLERYGLLDALREKKPGKLVGACPIHGGKNGTSFNVDVEKNAFHCFSQCGGGNVLDLVMKLENCSIRDAGAKLADWFGLMFERPRRQVPDAPPNGSKATSARKRVEKAEPKVASATATNPPLDRPLRDLNADHPYLVARGLTVPTIKTFGIGYCSRGLMRGRIAIPIHDEEGQLVAYAGRAVESAANGETRYRLPDGFKKSFVLFNLHRAREHAADGLIVVEGFFDCFRVHQAGYPNVVALMGSQASEAHVALLTATTDRVVLMFDGDDAGLNCTRDFWKRLRRRLFLKEVALDAGQQPDMLDADTLRRLLGEPPR
jgi:DNA primase